MRYDLAVIGSGGAAFAAAIAARRKDKSVVMVEQGAVGGTCVNTGCVPSKALLAAAEARHTAADHPFSGVHTSADLVDFGALLASKAELVASMRGEKYVDLAVEHGWEIIPGTARFAPGPALEVQRLEGGRERIEAEHYLVATGSMPTAPRIEGLAEAGYLTSTSAMELAALPSSMVVLGGNYIGLEMAQLFARLGTQVTVLEVQDQLAPGEDPEICGAIAGVFADEGIGVYTGSTLTGVDRDADGYTLRADARQGGQEFTLSAEQLLIATGRRPATDDLGLGDVGVNLGQRGHVETDAQLRTANPRIWAAGDVTGAPQFVYVAAAHGNLVADNAFDHAGRTLDYRYLPRVTFTSPNIAAVGLTDQQAHEQGLDCESRVLNLDKVPRALINRDTRGLVKIVAERGTGRVLGVSMIAAGAGDAIQAGVYAVQTGMTTREMAATWAPYLTVAEGLKLAAQAFHLDVAKLSCCAA